MTARKQANITMAFSDGSRFGAWERVSIREKFDDPLGSYSFTVRPPRARLREFQERLQKGELVDIAIDEKPRARPIIETVTTKVDRNGITMQVDCKSILLTSTQASADPTIYKTQKADVPIKDLILEVMKPFGLTKIDTDALGNAMTLSGVPISGREPAITAEKLKAKDAQVQDNESAYNYCARLFSRLGVALRVNWKGEMMLSAPSYDQHAIYTVVEDQGQKMKGDRAMGMTLTESNDGQFSKVVIRGKGKEARGKKSTAKPRAALIQPKLTGRFASSSLESTAQAAFTALSADAPFSGVVEKKTTEDQPLYTSSVHPFKPRYFVDKRSRDAERCASFCELVHGKNAPKAFQLVAEMRGVVASSGAIWTIDTMAHVYSEALSIDDDMWVYETNMDVSRGGTKTSVTLLPRNALVIGSVPS